MTVGLLLVLIALILAIIRLFGVNDGRLTAAAVALIAGALLLARTGL